MEKEKQQCSIAKNPECPQCGFVMVWMQRLEDAKETWVCLNCRYEEPLEKQQNQGKLKTLIEDVLSYGDLLLIANKGIGKTNTLMVLAEQFRALPDTKVIIFEDFPKWCNEFSEVPFMVVKDGDVIETRQVIGMEDYFLSHTSDYTVLHGERFEKALEENKDLIFLSQIEDTERQAFFIYSVVQYFYRKAYLRAYKGYGKRERIVFVIEESQNVFDSSTISRKIFNRLRKIFSVARNLDLHFVLASQRLQDLNTKIRGRTRLLLGQVNVDDYELKVRRLLRHSQYRDDILTFERGKFLYIATDSTVEFPLFQQHGIPYELVSEAPMIEEPKPKTLFRRLLEKIGIMNSPIERLPISLHESATWINDKIVSSIRIPKSLRLNRIFHIWNGV